MPTSKDIETRRARLRLSAKLRAEIAFKQALERIDHKLDVQEPALREFDREIEAGKTPKAIPKGDA